MLAGEGLLVQHVPVNGRYHCSAYASTVDRLVDFFGQTPDLKFPSTDQLHVSVRSAVDGKVIDQGDLVRHILENTLLKPIEWYKTLKLAVASLPPEHRCIAVAGISTHFPPSLLSLKVDIRLLSLHSRGFMELETGLAQDLPVGINGPNSHDAHASLGTPPSPAHTDTDDGVLSLEESFNTGSYSSTKSKSPLSDFPPHSVAIVGMAGRFPGANSVDQLWELISAGRSMVDSPPERVGLNQLTDDTSQVKWWGNFLDEQDTFDHKFFGKSAREATACDPQQRKLLEVVYEALESSGQLGAEACSTSCSTDYGCYIGAVMNNYATNVSCHPPTAYAVTGTTRAFLSGAVSHYFGWTGPAMTIDTACSSSLVAIHTACRAIVTGECSRAIAGGSNIITCPYDYRDLRAAGFLSPTGQCKPFDAGADGYCRGEAVGVVVLKSLTAALEEKDNILGVIVGSATSQNINSGPIVVPDVKSQAGLIGQVLNMSNVLPGNVSYVEAHGTGTSVGDPIEVSSLREAFGGPSRTSKLHFSSLKGNIGHGEAASGVAGLIKVLLMMRNGQIPPQASHRSLNPKITALGTDKMAIPTELTPWNPPMERVACVNNYGAAGNNSVVLIREAPTIGCGFDMAEGPTMCDTIPPSRWPLILSASSKQSLSLYGEKLLDWVRHMRSKRPSSAHLAIRDVLFNLAHRANHALNNVVSTSITDMSELESMLSAVASEGDIDTMITTRSAPPPPVIMLFGGQEGRFVGLSEAVYKSSQVFRHHLDTCHTLSVKLGLIGPAGLYPAVFQQEPLEDLVTLHVALFGVQYSCAKAWIDCGLKVAAVIGHSFGQLTALCVSGVLSLHDTLRLVAGRALLVEKHWGPELGSMVALQADRQRVGELLDRVGSQTGGYAEIACFNGPRNHVVVGSKESMRNVETFATGTGETQSRGSIRSYKLNVTHGFHSRFTEALLPQLAKLAEDLEWRSPTIHLEVCSDKEMLDVHEPDQYRHLTVEHTRRPVYFQHAAERLMRRYPQATWLEAGHGLSAAQLAQACAQHSDGHSFMGTQLTAANAQDSLVDVTVRLWGKGHGVQYWPFHRCQRWQYRHLNLPSYQFQKIRHWLPFVKSTSSATDLTISQPTEPKDEMLCLIKREELSTETCFRISPLGSKRLHFLLTSHVVCGHTLLPASAYIEVVSRAALILQEDLEAKLWVPTVENLAMRTPISGLGPDQILPNITIAMRRLDNPWPSWSFLLTAESSYSKNGDDPSMVAHETTTGSVHLHKRTDSHSQVAQDLRRFSAMMGQSLWEQIMNDPEAEGMRGKHLYRVFNQVVQYSDSFHGVKSIMCLGSKAAGTVRISPDNKGPPDQRLTDTPMIDSFMQFGGLLANCFNETVSTRDSLFVCHHVQRVQVGPMFYPDEKDWFVLANMTSIDQESVSVDVYVFETSSKRMVLTALGMSFAKTSATSFTRIVNSYGPGSDSHSGSLFLTKGREMGVEQTTRNDLRSYAIKNESTAHATNNEHDRVSKRADIIRIAASIADVPEHELTGETTMMSIVDSLGATEMIGDIDSALNVTIDLATFLLFPDINAIILHVDTQLGLNAGIEEGAVVLFPAETTNPGGLERPQCLSLTNGSDPGSRSNEQSHQFGNGNTPQIESASKPEVNKTIPPSIMSIHEAFENVRLTFDELGAGTNALDYWSDNYPDDVRLVLAYTTEAFRELSCNIHALSPGEPVPEVLGVLPRHRQLVQRLFQFLEQQGVIESPSSGVWTRTTKVIDGTPAEQIFDQVVGKHSLNAAIRHLMRAVGRHMADCLKGDCDALQILFGNRSNKNWLDKLYREWPMLITATQLLGNFLCQAFTENVDSQASTGTRTGPYRILEVGAGTGGTTRHIVNLLTSRGIPFEYHFTDISASLVQKARTSFAGIDGMRFSVLDIESAPELKFTEAFHAIISTNCIHATRDLTLSLGNLRKMLREDGALALIEMTPSATHPLYVMDVIVGLLEGWWLFDDSRSHALADVEHWAGAFSDAGFREVLWSDGATLEARTVRVICGFRKPKPNREKDSGVGLGPVGVSIQEVVYKTAGSQKVHADIYCPTSADSARKMPIGGFPGVQNDEISFQKGLSIPNSDARQP